MNIKLRKFTMILAGCFVFCFAQAQAVMSLSPNGKHCLSNLACVLQMTAGSGIPASLSIFNNSRSITTVRNLRAVLPADWSDVTQDASGCVTLPPQTSCTLTFTPGSTTHPATSIPIVGNGAQTSYVTMEVISGTPLTASATPSSLSVSSGQPAIFTANPVGGTTPYTYQWYSCTTLACISPTIIIGATSNTYNPSTAIPGTYYFEAIVTDAVSGTTTTNVVTLTVTSQYAYVTDFSTAVVKCPLNATGGFSGPCIALSNATPPGFNGAAGISFATFSGVPYGYVGDVSSILWQCPMDATGGFTGGACTALTNSTMSGFFATHTSNFATFSGTTYAYVADQLPPTLWQCPMDATGGFVGGACVPLTVNGPGNILSSTTATFSGTTYTFVPRTGAIRRCPMNATGGFSGVCTAMLNSTPPGFNIPFQLTFATFSGITYAYVADSSANLWQCPMDAAGNFSSGCVALTNGFFLTSGVIFATFSGTTYAYVNDQTSTLWQCPLDATGGFSAACTALTDFAFGGLYKTTLGAF